MRLPALSLCSVLSLAPISFGKILYAGINEVSINSSRDDLNFDLLSSQVESSASSRLGKLASVFLVDLGLIMPSSTRYVLVPKLGTS